MKIAILTWGTWYEREIALRSSRLFQNNLKIDYDLYILPEQIDNFLANYNGYQLIIPVFHWEYWEDGIIFGLLEALRLRYTFSAFKTHVVCMNKNMTNLLVNKVWVQIPESFLIENISDIRKIALIPPPKRLYYARLAVRGIYRKSKEVIKTWAPENFTKNGQFRKIKEVGIRVFDYEKSKIRYPAIVKPNNGWSSVATYKVENFAELEEAVQNVIRITWDTVLIQEFISWQEYSIPVIWNDNPEVLPIMKLQLNKSDFFDYDEKYNSDWSNEIFDQIEPELQKDLENQAKIIYKYLWCKWIARIDCIVNERWIFFLEVNTIPGLSDVSIFPKARKLTGKTLEELVERIVELGME